LMNRAWMEERSPPLLPINAMSPAIGSSTARRLEVSRAASRRAPQEPSRCRL
jgi:hypothetical protein